MCEVGGSTRCNSVTCKSFVFLQVLLFPFDLAESGENLSASDGVLLKFLTLQFVGTVTAGKPEAVQALQESASQISEAVKQNADKVNSFAVMLSEDSSSAAVSDEVVGTSLSSGKKQIGGEAPRPTGEKTEVQLPGMAYNPSIGSSRN